jgi:hypothetical protein
MCPFSNVPVFGCRVPPKLSVVITNGKKNEQTIFSGRDKNVWMTDLKSTDRRALVCQESAPVLKMVLTPVKIVQF